MQVLHEVLDQRNLVLDGKVARRVAQLHGARRPRGCPSRRGSWSVTSMLARPQQPSTWALEEPRLPAGSSELPVMQAMSLQRAGVLHRVARLVGGQLVVDAAVAVQRVQAGGVGAHRLFDLLGRNLGDLAVRVARCTRSRLSLERLPHGAGLDGRAVLRASPQRRRGTAPGSSASPWGWTSRPSRCPRLSSRRRRSDRPGRRTCEGSGSHASAHDGLVGMLDPRAGGGDA